MTTKRITATIAVALTAGLLLTSCAPASDDKPTTPPTTSQTSTPTPTPTATTVAAPASEEEAILAAEARIQDLLKAQSEIHAAGGTDTSPYQDLATKKALTIYEESAARIAKGPIANEDSVNVEGQSSTQGSIKFEPQTAYGQESNGVPNGLVIVPGCMDATDYVVTTADGKPAYRPESLRTRVEFQVTYDAERKLWLVSDRITFDGETC